MSVRKPAKERQASTPERLPAWLSGSSWGVTTVMVAVAVFFLLARNPFLPGGNTRGSQQEPAVEPEVVEAPPVQPPNVALPELTLPGSLSNISRLANAYTIIPNRSRTKAAEYTVMAGDSVFSIAKEYNLKPETVLWANYDILNDNPNFLSVDQTLRIPPADGIYYKWKEGDTLEKVAQQYRADPQDIISWPGNNLDITNPVIAPDAYVMIPGGWRESQQFVVPTVWRAGAGANRTISGPGSCSVPEGGAYGTGFFVWPSMNHYLSGNDFWSGHLGIDIAGPTGAPVYAADSGVVVYAGVIGGGYGNMIMIDHGNGFHTLYAHLNAIYVACGQSVVKGQGIGQVGSTGNSTGPHLHFEIRYLGQFMNPWDYVR